MTNLISGKEAKLAWANGEELEFYSPDLDVWFGLNDEPFMSDVFATRPIRLKPRTITLNVEIPAPFETKVGDIYYFINSSNLKGYGFNKFSNDGDDECLTFYGAWRTEEEIKQVVAALRQIFGGV